MPITIQSTGKAPFEVIYGNILLPPILRSKDQIFAANEYVRDLDTAYDHVKCAIMRTWDKQKKAANKHCRSLDLTENQWVLLNFKKARLRNQAGKVGQVVKLANKYYGPFHIIEKINDVSFRLALPAHWKIHNAFHVSLLKTYVGEPPKDPISEDSAEVDELEEVLQPEKIISHQDRKLRGGKNSTEVLVKFKNYSPLDDGNRFA